MRLTTYILCSLIISIFFIYPTEVFADKGKGNKDTPTPKAAEMSGKIHSESGQSAGQNNSESGQPTNQSTKNHVSENKGKADSPKNVNPSEKVNKSKQNNQSKNVTQSNRNENENIGKSSNHKVDQKNQNIKIVPTGKSSNPSSEKSKKKRESKGIQVSESKKNAKDKSQNKPKEKVNLENDYLPEIEEDHVVKEEVLEKANEKEILSPKVSKIEEKNNELSVRRVEDKVSVPSEDKKVTKPKEQESKPFSEKRNLDFINIIILISSDTFSPRSTGNISQSQSLSFNFSKIGILDYSFIATQDLQSIFIGKTKVFRNQWINAPPDQPPKRAS